VNFLPLLFRYSLIKDLIFGLLRFLVVALLISCSSTHKADKIRGFNLEAPPMEVGMEEMHPIREGHADWVALVPYGYTPNGSSKVYYDSPNQWWGERPRGIREMIRSAKSLGFKVMLKPQVWIPGNWVGDYYPEDRPTWENSMLEFVMNQAKLAAEMEVDLFCLATEYKSMSIKHPAYFEILIDSVRQVYRGELTYAANWDEYEQIAFWEKLDYIGVNAYFPLSLEARPELGELEEAWGAVLPKLEAMSVSHGKPILFTEFGYRSVEGAAGRQWELDDRPFNAEVQSVAFRAFFNEAWSVPWCAGGFIWKWRFFDGAGGEGDRSYSPQGKPAMEVIRKAYRE